MLSIIVSPLQAQQSQEALLVFTIIIIIIFSFLFFFVCYHDNSWKAQPTRSKCSHMTLIEIARASSKMGITGHM